MKPSVWNSTASKRGNASLSSAHVITEFERTKKQRIFAHKLGRISFVSKDVNSPRNEVIDTQDGNIVLDGFRYKSVGHTYIPAEVIQQDQENQFLIYSHGHPLGGTEHGGLESCVRSGLSCKDGEGTDQLCNPGKCIIGTLAHVRNKKWVYTSANQYKVSGDSTTQKPLVYFINGEKEIALRTVLRGKVNSFDGQNSVTLDVDLPASKYSRILLPPKYYFSDDFKEGDILVSDSRLNGVYKKPSIDIVGVESRKNRFVSSAISKVYPNKSDEYLSLILYEDGVRNEVKEGIKELFSSLPTEWVDKCNSIIEEEYLYRELYVYNNLLFIIAVYDRIKELFNSIIQVARSSLKRSNLDFYKYDIARPVYSRLPGVSEGYRSDSLMSDDETPAQWITSGVDEFLSRKKDQISSFYRDYLDPETCSPLVLDWLAQHVGLFGPLWDERWDRKIKVAMIQNAFGWYSREKTVTLPGIGEIKTPKGEALSKFPFNSSQVWTSDPEEDNSLKIMMGEVSEIMYSDDSNPALGVESEYVFKQKVFEDQQYRLSTVGTNSVKVYDGKWNGLMEAKGSMLSFVFLSSIFDLKSHSSTELETYKVIPINTGTSTYKLPIKKPRIGLRSGEYSAPPLWPYKSDILQVGGEVMDSNRNVISGNDLKIGNYTNQIVAGYSRVTTIEDSKNVFFRVPYYYNRDGKSWDRTKYIADNWLPDNLNKRIQYAYLSADLWAVGDGFFEPNVVQNISGHIPFTSEDGDFLLTAEDSTVLEI